MAVRLQSNPCCIETGCTRAHSCPSSIVLVSTSIRPAKYSAMSFSFQGKRALVTGAGKGKIPLFSQREGWGVGGNLSTSIEVV